MGDNTDNGNAVPAAKSGSDTDTLIGKSSGAPGSNAGAITGFVDPAIARSTTGTGAGDSVAPGNSDSGEPRRGRGRHPNGCNCNGCVAKRASGEKPQPVKAETSRNLNIDGVEKILFSIHSVGAALLSIPELELEEAEAKKLAKSISAVNDQYKLTLDPKKAAWVDLCTAASTIYGPRAISLYLRKMNEKPKVVAPVATAAPDKNPVNAPNVNGNLTPARMPGGFDPSNIKIVN